MSIQNILNTNTLPAYNPVTLCPKDVLNYLFSYVRYNEPQADRSLALVCKSWSDLVKDGPFYKSFKTRISDFFLGKIENIKVAELKKGNKIYPCGPDNTGQPGWRNRLLGNGDYLVETGKNRFAVIPCEEDLSEALFHVHGRQLCRMSGVSFADTRFLSIENEKALIETPKGDVFFVTLADVDGIEQLCIERLKQQANSTHATLSHVPGGNEAHYHGFLQGSSLTYFQLELQLATRSKFQKSSFYTIDFGEAQNQYSVKSHFFFKKANVLAVIFEKEESESRLVFYKFSKDCYQILNHDVIKPEICPIEDDAFNEFTAIEHCSFDERAQRLSVFTPEFIATYVFTEELSSYYIERQRSLPGYFYGNNANWTISRGIDENGAYLHLWNHKNNEVRKLPALFFETNEASILDPHGNPLKGRYWLGHTNLLFFAPVVDVPKEGNNTATASDLSEPMLADRVDVWGLKGPTLLASLKLSSYLPQGAEEREFAISELRQSKESLFVTASVKSGSKTLPGQILRIPLPYGKLPKVSDNEESVTKRQRNY